MQGGEVFFYKVGGPLILHGFEFQGNPVYLDPDLLYYACSLLSHVNILSFTALINNHGDFKVCSPGKNLAAFSLYGHGAPAAKFNGPASIV